MEFIEETQEILTPTTMQVVQKHKLHKSNKYYKLFLDYCHKSKNLANQVNFEFKKALKNKEKWPKYCALDKYLKSLVEFNSYRNMPTAQCAQQTIRLVCKNWKSFEKSIKDYRKHPEKYLGQPRPPKYYKKNGYAPLILTNQNCIFNAETGIIRFPQVFDGFEIKTNISERQDFIGFNQIQILPKSNYLEVSVVYTVHIQKEQKQNERYIALDLGVNNLAVVCSNVPELKPFIIDGKKIKWINQYCNKQIAHYQSLAFKMNGLYNTNRISKLYEKREYKIHDLLHKKSKDLIDICIEHDISTIIIGYNEGWKQDVELGKNK